MWLGSSDGDPGQSDALANEVSSLEVPPDVEDIMPHVQAADERMYLDKKRRR